MKPSTFIAIFIPVISTIIITLFIAVQKGKKPDPRIIRIAVALSAAGIVVLVFLFLKL